jgi:hypothetical protein
MPGLRENEIEFVHHVAAVDIFFTVDAFGNRFPTVRFASTAITPRPLDACATLIHFIAKPGKALAP